MKGILPVLQVSGENIAESWENSLISLWEHGIDVPTKYDNEGDPPSKEATVTIVVNDPFAEPRIHRGLPGGFEDLEIYRQEVMNGIHNHWIDHDDPMKWKYSYHERLFVYDYGSGIVDQINDAVIPDLVKTWHTRKAQATTWKPWYDPYISGSPCLQRAWFRLLPNDNGQFVLNMTTHWRSRDAFKAAFMNIFALTYLQKYTAEKLSQLLEQEVLLGSYIDISNSYHIYGKDFLEFMGFLKMRETRFFEERTWTTEFAELIFQEVREKLVKDPDFMIKK